MTTFNLLIDSDNQTRKVTAQQLLCAGSRQRWTAKKV